MVTCDCLWLHVIVCNWIWSFLIARNCLLLPVNRPWLPVIAHHCLWISVIACDCPPLPMNMRDCLWLSVIACEVFYRSWLSRNMIHCDIIVRWWCGLRRELVFLGLPGEGGEGLAYRVLWILDEPLTTYIHTHTNTTQSSEGNVIIYFSKV